MPKKTKKRKVESSYNIQSSHFRNSIGLTLIGSLMLVLAVIMLITFITSVDVIRSAQANAQANFYDNTLNTTLENLKKEYFTSQNKQTTANFEKILVYLQFAMNRQLMKAYEIKDIYISDITNLKEPRLVYTTLKKDKNNDYSYNLSNPIPLIVKKSSSYVVSKYTLMSYQTIFKNRIYSIYLVVQKPTSEYRKKITGQLMIIFAFIIVASLIWMTILVRSITNPLNSMEKTVSKIAKGDLSGRLDLTRYEELNRLVGSYNMMANALQRLYSSLETQVQDRTRELKGAYAELQNTQAMMVHSEKMKSLGELVAGIMHEINNPINFIYGNMTHLNNYSKDLINLIEEYTKFEVSLNDAEKSRVSELKKEFDYEFLKTDMPDLIKSCKEGAERAKNIIQDLKSFSRMEEVSIKYVNVPTEIDTVLNILHNKIKNKAQVHKEYMENVPNVEAFGGQLNQVFMNILDNAVGAIEKTGDIWIRINTDTSKTKLVIEIEDNGQGMDDETVNKVFDPFFTTKPVGQGTGLGMSITYKIIKNHQGDIDVISRKGQGTKFIITLPINIDRENIKTSVASGDKENNG